MASNDAAFASLAKIRETMKRIGDGDVVRGMKEGIIDASLPLIRQGFLGEKDPSGTPWKKKVKDNGPILVKTRAMMNSWKGRVAARGIIFSNGRAYSKYHQEGTAILPVREMIPEPNGALPTEWKNTWELVSNRVFDYWMAK